MSKPRVRFAPSPTGPLHIGGVRTALYNYLYAKQTGGTFILRVEDTDQTRYVPGAEDYIKESLEWFGLIPDEGPGYGGDYGPYRQSERKDLYAKYATQLVEEGKAYYAFDTAEDLDQMRAEMEAKGVHSAKYNYETRGSMKNSLTLSADEVQKHVDSGNYTIRLKVPQGEVISFTDAVREKVSFQSNELDDKIILKGDGMPTYHLANIVDDHLMEITHVIRGEEWLSSTAHHVLMYQYFGWEAPTFAHLPLILKPTGKGKLSKRDGAKFGFPVFPLEWKQNEEETYAGFREDGYLPEAVINFLALLGWNDGTDEEMFSLEELIKVFDPRRIVKSGARFDVDKSRWFNQQYIIKSTDAELAAMLTPMAEQRGIAVEPAYLAAFARLMKERVERLPEFFEAGAFFFEAPTAYDEKTIRKKYKVENEPHFRAMIEGMRGMGQFTANAAETFVKSYISDHELSFGAVLPILRVALSGSMAGPDLFETMELLGQEEVLNRLERGLTHFTEVKSNTDA